MVSLKERVVSKERERTLKEKFAFLAMILFPVSNLENDNQNKHSTHRSTLAESINFTTPLGKQQ